MHNTLISELESLQPTALDAGLVFSGKTSGKLIQDYAAPTFVPDFPAMRAALIWLAFAKVMPFEEVPTDSSVSFVPLPPVLYRM